MEFCLEPRVFCTRIFLMLWCLELLRQHYVEFRPVQFCFRSIKTKLHRVFFMQCCLKDLGQHCAGLSRCIVVQSLRNNIAQGFYLCKIVWSFLDNTEHGFLSVLSCPKSISRDNIVLSLRLRTTLHKKKIIQYCLDTLGTTIAQVKTLSNVFREAHSIFFISITLIYISQTNIYLNTLKKRKEKSNHAIVIQQKNKTYTILDPTLKQVIVRLH